MALRGAQDVISSKIVYDLSPNMTNQMIDPVCGMQVDFEKANSKNCIINFETKEYAFCCSECLDLFKENPHKYLNQTKKETPEHHKPNTNQKISTNARYTCPMHPEIIQMGAGSCPKCGMALEPRDFDAADDSENPELTDFRKRFIVSLVFTVPLFFISMGGMFVHISYAGWIQFLLATPVVVWAALPFFERAWMSLKTREYNMFTLIGIGVAAAYLYSIFALIFSNLLPKNSFDEMGMVKLYFESAAVIVALVFLGQVLELKARGKTASAIKSLLKLAPEKALRINRNLTEELVDLSEVQVGDILKVKEGEKIPVDGFIIDGNTTIDESMLTGESIPIEKTNKSEVFAATMNLTSTIMMKATKIGADTMLSRIVKLVSEAQRSKAKIQELADKISQYFVPAVVISSCISFLVWFFFGPDPKFINAILNAVAVLIVACPCALGLATPMSVMVGMGRGAKKGVLFKNAQSIQELSNVDVVFFDKTGTLTVGKPKVIQFKSQQNEEKKALEIAFSLAKNSTHPLSKAIVQHAQKLKINSMNVEKYTAFPGNGIEANIAGNIYKLGNQKFTSAQILTNENETNSQVFLTENNQLIAVIHIQDEIRDSAMKVVNEMKAMKIKPILLSGDRIAVVENVASKLGIEEFYSECLPQAKSEIIAKYSNYKTAMVGDGINDAPAMAKATIGIAMGSGVDIAIESSQVVLLQSDLSAMLSAIKLSKLTFRNIKQNLFWAFAYNAVGVPLAAGVLYPFTGSLLSPMIAAVAMSFSSVSVVLNALRINFVKLN